MRTASPVGTESLTDGHMYQSEFLPTGKCVWSVPYREIQSAGLCSLDGRLRELCWDRLEDDAHRQRSRDDGYVPLRLYSQKLSL